MEAPLATLSPSRLNDLIQRFLYSRRDASHALFDIARPNFPAVRVLAEAARPTSRQADEAWLQRVELRGSRRVIEILETSGFRARIGMMQALFVDDRCGLIASELIGEAARIDANVAVAAILRRASSFHASGIILAMHDPTGAIASAPRCRRLTMELYRKGEAIDLFLLDHFVLTAKGWKRMFTVSEEERI